MHYRLGCSLAYTVKAPATFIVNVEVASEALTLSPELERAVYVSPDVKNRYLGVNVAPGPIRLD